MDVLYAIAGALYDFMMAGPGIVLSLLYVVVVGMPLTLLHELGHAVTARDRLGTDVDVKVGHAGKIADLRLGGISASLNALQNPFGPAGSASFEATRATARDVIWIAVSGPAASLIGAIFALILYSAAPDHGLVHDLLWTAVGVSLFAFLDLVPIELKDRKGATVRTDGRLALDALKVTRQLR